FLSRFFRLAKSQLRSHARSQRSQPSIAATHYEQAMQAMQNCQGLMVLPFPFATTTSKSVVAHALTYSL
ncbi:hypothetical protein HaLaN_32766, partial [Haematococcus lacustris]